LFDFREGAVFVVIMMLMLVIVPMVMISMRVAVALPVLMVVMVMVLGMSVPVLVVMCIGQMNIEFYPGNSRFFLARNMEVKTIEPQFLQFMLELMRVHAKVQQCAQKHIAADAAEDIEVKSFHAGEKTSNIER
jgi:hypothetical protein